MVSPKYCQCPVPCEEVAYNPTLSLGAISNFETDTLLKSSHTANIQKRYVETLEIKQRMLEPNIIENMKLIVPFAQALKRVLGAFERVQKQLRHAREFTGNLTTEMLPRVNFHLTKALSGVTHIVKQNFIRGWQVIDERTLHHVTTQFYETINVFDRTVTKLRQISSDDSTTRRVLYLMTEEDMSSKLELAIRSVDNLTKAYYAYLDAQPLMHFPYTPDERYDTQLVPAQILAHNTIQQREYYNNMTEHLTGYIDSILSLKSILKDVYKTNILNNTAYILAKAQFIQHSKSINYYRYMFTQKIVMRSQELLEERMKAFEHLNNSFHSVIKEIKHIIHSVQSALHNRVDELKGKVLFFAELAEQYLQNGTVTKPQLASLATSSELQAIIKSLVLFFKETRIRGEELHLGWMQLKSAYMSLWTSMISESTVSGFYATLYDDIRSLIGTNDTDRLNRFRTNFAHSTLLNISEAEVATIPLHKLYELLNADISRMDLTTKGNEIRKQFMDIQESTDILESLGNTGIDFIHAFEKLTNNLGHFTQTSSIGIAFLR
jgi:acid-sensing ion channel 2